MVKQEFKVIQGYRSTVEDVLNELTADYNVIVKSMTSYDSTLTVVVELRSLLELENFGEKV